MLHSAEEGRDEQARAASVRAVVPVSLSHRMYDVCYPHRTASNPSGSASGSGSRSRGSSSRLSNSNTRSSVTSNRAGSKALPPRRPPSASALVPPPTRTSWVRAHAILSPPLLPQSAFVPCVQDVDADAAAAAEAMAAVAITPKSKSGRVSSVKSSDVPVALPSPPEPSPFGHAYAHLPDPFGVGDAFGGYSQLSSEDFVPTHMLPPLYKDRGLSDDIKGSHFSVHGEEDVSGMFPSSRPLCEVMSAPVCPPDAPLPSSALPTGQVPPPVAEGDEDDDDDDEDDDDGIEDSEFLPGTRFAPYNFSDNIALSVATL